MKNDAERRALLNICEGEKEGTPNANKISILLENTTKESFVHSVEVFSKQAEERLLGPPPALEFFPPGEDPALRVAQLRNKLV